MRMNNRAYVETDRNGTKIYHDFTCDRCGGQGGADAWTYTGWTCYKCGGTGRMDKPSVYKEYTPEYRAILDERARIRQEKKDAKYRADRIAQAEQLNNEFLEKHFFGKNQISVIKGNTFQIKEELKSEGCKFHEGIGWYAKETNRECWFLGLNQATRLDEFGVRDWKAYAELDKMAKEVRNAEFTGSEYQFNIGDKIEIELETISAIRVEGKSFGYYDSGVSYINKFKDSNGNIFIWKTSKPTSGKGKIKGTIKAHEEYAGVKQTILTRCKVAEEN